MSSPTTYPQYYHYQLERYTALRLYTSTRSAVNLSTAVEIGLVLHTTGKVVATLLAASHYPPPGARD